MNDRQRIRRVKGALDVETPSTMPWMTNATNATTAGVIWTPPPAPEPERGPLNRLQFRLFENDDRLSTFVGNRISDLRYWLWRLSR